MVCVLSRYLVEELLLAETKSGGFVVGFDKVKISVVAKIALTERLGSQVIDLRHFKIVEHSLQRIILGA